MPEEVGTEATRSDAPSADDANGRDEQDPQGSDDAAAEKPQEAQDSGDAGDEPAQSEDLKVVVSIKGGRAIIGVQQPTADPHIETFEYRDLSELAEEVLAVTERAKSRWEDTPKHPAYERPAPPARQRNRRRQGAAQGTTTVGAETEQAQQQTLRLF